MNAIVRLVIGGLIAVFTVAALLPAAHAQSTASISTDAPVYHPGDPITICYTVPGAGPITITDYSSDGSSAVLASWYDDGTGWCFAAVAQGPASTEQLVLNWQTGTNSGTSATTYRVVDATGDVVLTLADNNRTVTVAVGQRLRVELGIGYIWQLASSNATVLQAEPNPTPGVQGLWRAIAPGQATISGRGDPPCYPLCLAPSRLFTVTVKVN